MNLSTEAYAEMTRLTCSLGVGIVSVLEGGYDLTALSASAVAHVRALLEN
jgi:acetoin utilization deacetylase AcuC-like enzyme